MVGKKKEGEKKEEEEGSPLTGGPYDQRNFTTTLEITNANVM